MRGFSGIDVVCVQVQTLVAELDELAVKQAEEEVKRIESDTDGRSSKSRKSPSSLEFNGKLVMKHSLIELLSFLNKIARLLDHFFKH